MQNSTRPLYSMPKKDSDNCLFSEKNWHRNLTFWVYLIAQILRHSILGENMFRLYRKMKHIILWMFLFNQCSAFVLYLYCICKWTVLVLSRLCYYCHCNRFVFGSNKWPIIRIPKTTSKYGHQKMIKLGNGRNA